MSIDYSINGALKTNATDYSVTEDSTPVDPSDTTGGVGQFTVHLPEGPDTKLVRGKTLVLFDGSQGQTTGKIDSMDGDGMSATITANSRMNLLNVTRTAAPFQGTLEAAFRYYLSLAGVTNGIVVSTGLSQAVLTFPGWSGIVWDQVKALMAARHVETSLASNNIILRPLRQRIAQNYRDASHQWGIDATNIAQSVQINYYQSAMKAGALVYPLGGWTSDLQSYQVDAGQSVSYNISLDPPGTSDGGTPSLGDTLGASITNVSQPSCVSSVDPTYTASSVYTVSGSDGLPITPAQWTAQGGKITVTIAKDTRSINVNIRGASSAQYAPYTIGMSSGSNTYYSSLRLTGDGVFYDKQLLTLPTGNSADIAPTQVGAVVDSPFINTQEEAFRCGLHTLASYSSAVRSISVTTTGINRTGATDSYVYMTAKMFNADPDFAGITAAQFNTKFAGLTAAQFNVIQFAKVQDDFANQAFGNVAGARVFSDGGWHRIRSVGSLTPSVVSYTAEQDDIMSDFNTFYAGMTAAQFNALHAGHTAAQFNARPFITAS